MNQNNSITTENCLLHFYTKILDYKYTFVIISKRKKKKRDTFVMIINLAYNVDMPKEIRKLGLSLERAS